MESTSEVLARGVAHHQAGRLGDAEQIYRQILAAENDNAQAWNLLGVLEAQRGNHLAAADHFGRAIATDAAVAAFHRNQGNVYRRLARVDDALASFHRALHLDPNNAEAQHHLANFLQALGKPDEAIACYRRAIELAPNAAEPYHNLGTILQEQGRLDEAIACYRRALELNPNLAQTHNNLGNALREQGQWNDAIACYRRAINFKPDLAEAHNNLGNALLELGKTDEASLCYRRAIELNPGYAEAHNNLGNALRELKRPDEAVACYRRAVEIDPDYLAALGALVFQLENLCQWQDLNALSRRVIDAVDHPGRGDVARPISPFSFITLPTVTTAEQQLRCTRQWVARGLGFSEEPARRLVNTRPEWNKSLSENRLGEGESPIFLPDPPADGARRKIGTVPDGFRIGSKSRLTIGYLSADFQSHATAMLIAELIERHDRDRFSIFAYSYGRDDGGPMRARLLKAFDRFVDVQDLSFQQAAERIAADEVDILVDLKGYTGDARTQITALRPAPIQVNYLGYPGTMGASFVDYILVDDFVVPADQQPFFTEKLVHLPGCYQVNDSRREIAPRTPSRAECGLPDEGFVFCSFNNSYKITPEVFGVWMRLLAAAPGSVLWLFEANRFAAANLRREAQARGVAPERLVFAPRRAPAEHLARHRLADLFLDTFPVNAHTTASDALWAGCPLVTIAGQTFVSRVAGSLLRAVGMEELIASNLGEYEALALRLAREPNQLAELRAQLQASRATSAVFSGERFARGLEQAYATMWQIHSAGEPPRAFRVGPASVDRPHLA